MRLRNSILAMVALLMAMVAIVAISPPKENSVVVLHTKAVAIEQAQIQKPSVDIINPAQIFAEINDYSAATGERGDAAFMNVFRERVSAAMPERKNRTRILNLFEPRQSEPQFWRRMSFYRMSVSPNLRKFFNRKIPIPNFRQPQLVV